MRPFLPKVLLHLEGLTAGCAALIVYHALEASWLEFSVLLLGPDVAMLAYVFGKKIGAAVYNSVHTYTVVGAAWLVGRWTHWPEFSPLCVIWVAHIGFDRALGYGLKYPSGFKDTHLGRV
jgi:hypothetical protein